MSSAEQWVNERLYARAAKTRMQDAVMNVARRQVEHCPSCDHYKAIHVRPQGCLECDCTIKPRKARK